RRAVAHSTGVGTYDWSPDGSQVAFIASTPAPPSNGLPYQARIYEEADRQRPVYVAEAFSNVAAEPLFTDGTAYALDWHPDGDRIAAMVAPDPLVDSRYVRQTVRVYDLDGEVVASVDHRGKKGGLAWSPDGASIAFLAGANINDPAVGRLFVVPASGGAPTDVIPGVEGHVTGFFWDDDDEIDYLMAVGTEVLMGEVDAEINDYTTVQFEVGETEIEPGMAIWSAASASADGNHVALIGHTPMHPAELFVIDRGGEIVRLTDSNPWLSDVRLARQETVTHTARDGVTLEGVMIYPLGEMGGPSPLVLLVHGGPEAHVSNGWVTSYSRPGQTLAARGIAAFYPNYRGSTGRGVEFSILSQGDPAGAEFDDLADARDHFVDSGFALADAVGIAGGSYGGYATAWGSTYYSEKFAAGVMFVGISNKVSKVGTTDIPDEEFYVHARKRPWDNWTYFLERSPIYYADQQETPLLIAHGEDDPRVDPGQSMEMYRHLKLRGNAPVRLVFYPGEGHGNRRATAQLDFHLRTLRWFEHYLQGDGGEPPSSDLPLDGIIGG
ncbi:MAG: prolyl oligopeptidase family serine peptidase, partial [Bacteroidota bacterium]